MVAILSESPHPFQASMNHVTGMEVVETLGNITELAREG